MPHLSPPTLSESEQRAILRTTAGNPRDHVIYSLAFGTSLRLRDIGGGARGDMDTWHRIAFRTWSQRRARCSLVMANLDVEPDSSVPGDGSGKGIS